MSDDTTNERERGSDDDDARRSAVTAADDTGLVSEQLFVNEVEETPVETENGDAPR